MTRDEVLAEFRAAGALLEGHFILSSGLRSPVFLQKAKVFADPARTEKLCKALAEKVKAELADQPTMIVSPAVGGIVPGYETARQMGLKALYVEREGGEFTLRRGFELSKDDKVLVVEDIVTTGLSSRFSGTRQTACGLWRRAISSISSVAAISRFSGSSISSIKRSISASVM